MKQTKKIFKPVVLLFDHLSSKPHIGGLQISDSGIQCMFLKGGAPKIVAVKLPPGIVRDGKIENQKQFENALEELRKLIDKQRENEKIHVVVSLSPAAIYTQGFDVPNLGEDRLEETVLLNLQMISPIPAKNAYMSAQIAREDLEKIEFFGAFIERKTIDTFVESLVKVNFIPTAFEFPALSLSRLLLEVDPTVEKKRSILVFHISSDGMDIFVMKGGRILFDYFRSWKAIQGANRMISKEVFEMEVLEEMQRVVNFVLGRFKEDPEEVYLVSPGYEEEVRRILQNRFKFKISTFPSGRYAVDPQWYGTLGSMLRGQISLSEDKNINVSPQTSMQMYNQEQILNFITLWRDIAVVVLVILLISFGVSTYYLSKVSKQVTAQLTSFGQKTNNQDFQILKDKVVEYNKMVSMIQGAKGTSQSLSGFLTDVASIARKHRIDIKNFGIGSVSTPMQVSGEAPGYDAVINFKNELESKPYVTKVVLPVAKIVSSGGGGAVNFSLELEVNPAKIPAITQK